jgi:hypothetical protein
MRLDKVLVEKPADRLDLKSFLQELRKVRELVIGNFAPLKPSVGIQCRFCGLGTYQRLGVRVTDSVARLMSNYHSATQPTSYP